MTGDSLEHEIFLRLTNQIHGHSPVMLECAIFMTDWSINWREVDRVSIISVLGQSTPRGGEVCEFSSSLPRGFTDTAGAIQRHQRRVIAL